jgi:hypothetical protein
MPGYYMINLSTSSRLVKKFYLKHLLFLFLKLFIKHINIGVK